MPGAPLSGDPAASPGGALHGASGHQICFGSGTGLCGSANPGLLSDAHADDCACQRASHTSLGVTSSVHKAGCCGDGICMADLGHTIVICKKACCVPWSVHKEGSFVRSCEVAGSVHKGLKDHKAGWLR